MNTSGQKSTQQINNEQIKNLFDRELVAHRLKNNATNQIDFISKLVNEDMFERLALISRPFKKAAIIGPNAAILPNIANSADGEILFERFSTLVPQFGQKPLDVKDLKLPNKDYDLIVSLLDLQIINNVPNYLKNIRSHLAPDGLMLLAAIGGNSLNELRHAWLSAESEIYGNASTRVIPFIDVKNAGTLLQHCGFTLAVSDIDSHIVRYSSPMQLMQELHDLSASNPLFEKAIRPVTKKLLQTACEKYCELASDEDNRIRTTLEILWLSGWASHESQQKPLKPGSAQISLSKVLNNKEFSKNRE